MSTGSRRPVLLMADDRATSFTRYAARALPHDLVLLRFAEARRDLSDDYLRQTAHLPAFWVRAGVPLAEEARRYRAWARRLPLAPDRFCNPSEPRQALAQRFAALAGLPHLTERQVRWVRDKGAMKDRFRELGLRTAAYARVTSAADVAAFAARCGWPVVLKPADSFACVDTYRLAGPHQLAGLDLTARDWLVEEHLGGTEWEVCALLHGGEVLDAWPSAMPCRPLDIVEGAMNANISVATDEVPALAATPAASRAALRALVQTVATGMGLDHGYVHMEFFLIGGEVYAGEIGLRIAGCEIAANHGHAYGFDVFGATLDVHLGRRPRLRYGERRCVGDLLLPLPGSGTVRRITPRAELLRIPGVLDAVLRVRPGDPVAARRASHTASGYVHVSGATIREVEERMRQVLDAFTIEVAPAVPRPADPPRGGGPGVVERAGPAARLPDVPGHGAAGP
ncbi:ATP-dependent carboxylate-amine ligase [Streptomyces sp. RS10V-4]|uniref:ATP-grasp domain-containing protein n=1 Tax=Streptomyces rhizoryzae TaxID=2932493 RepID=UPI00200379A5|nr:ATP-dependent carboxylate-amine ligase [Streptomyces rhizoryzae]MCK7623766.1 ATP-dependent carboxylate-amine ligase [Streptomyces rhizoryzae]